MLKRTVILLILLALGLGASGCRLSVNRLNKRLDRWESLRNKEGDTERKVKFARESLAFFLNTLDFQRSKETLVSEAERLQYHEKMSGMQVFLLDYHAGLAMQAAEAGDWATGDLEWARADSLSRGNISTLPQTTYKMVLLQAGYDEYLRQISSQGDIYNRLEFRFPGLMEGFRKMSRFQYLKAEKLFAETEWEQALKHYLLVFKRDPQDFALAEERVRFLSGKNTRQVYERQFQWDRIVESYDAMSIDLFGITEEQIMSAQTELGADKWQEKLPDIWKQMGTQYKMQPEQAADVYFMIKHLREGTLPAYISLWRYDVLRGNRPAMLDISELRG
ncbi:hypothetical protein LLH00_16575 [bacterium]|nr:hypothetical protein [bacterium]